MELLSFVTAKPGSKAWSFPFCQKTTPSLSVPIGSSGMTPVENLPVPQSGLERAEWSSKMIGAPPARAATFCTAGAPSIGKMERMVQGAERDAWSGSLVIRSHSGYDYNDPVSENSENLPYVWTAQTSSSNGLWHGERDDVYVSNDSETIWS